jgi:hypothetical protein
MIGLINCPTVSPCFEAGFDDVQYHMEKGGKGQIAAASLETSSCQSCVSAVKTYTILIG